MPLFDINAGPGLGRELGITGGGEDKGPSRRNLARRQLYDVALQPGGPVTQESPTETASLTALEQLSQRLLGGTGPEAETFALGRNTLADVLSQAGPTFENYFQQGVADPMWQFYQERIQPNLDTELARSGFFGSARSRALGSANEKLVRALTESKAGLAKELLDTRLRGAGMAPELASPETDLLMKLLEAGDTRRQKEIDRIKLVMQLLGGPHVGPQGPSEGRQNAAAALRVGGAALGGIIGGPPGAAAGGTIGDVGTGTTSGGVATGDWRRY